MGQHTFNFEAMQSYQNKIVGLIKEQLTKLDNERVSLEAKKSQLEQRNASIAQQISSLTAQLSSSDEDNNNASIMSQISALESEMTANESTISSISSRLSAISSLKSELDTGITETNNYLKNIEEAIQEADGDASKAAKAIQNQLSAYNTKIKDIINSVNHYREIYTDTDVGITFDGKDFGVELETALKNFDDEIDALDKKTLIEIINIIRNFMLDSSIDENRELLIIEILRGLSKGMKFVNGEMVYVFDLSKLFIGGKGEITSTSLKTIKEIMGAGGKTLDFLIKYTPIISTILDFVLMLQKGEDPTDAAIKALAHVALSSLASAAGGAIGTTIGTAIGPGIGTAAGMLIGVFAGSLTSNLFDMLYEEYISDFVHSTDEWVTGKMNDFGNWVQGKPASTGGVVGVSRSLI